MTVEITVIFSENDLHLTESGQITQRLLEIEAKIIYQELNSNIFILTLSL